MSDNNKLGIVQYWVFKRPKNARGRVVYGAELGATKNEASQIFQGETLLINNGGTKDVPEPTDPASIRNKLTVATDAVWEPIIGQPWILHSVHFGVDEALKSAKPLIISIGEDNVKICKILSHQTVVKMS